MRLRFRKIREMAALGALFSLSSLLQGCSRIVNFEGIYLPAWVICLTLGVIGSATALYYLQRGSLRDCLPNHGLCFVCFSIILGTLSWLIFFRT